MLWMMSGQLGDKPLNCVELTISNEKNRCTVGEVTPKS